MLEDLYLVCERRNGNGSGTSEEVFFPTAEDREAMFGSSIRSTRLCK